MTSESSRRTAPPLWTRPWVQNSVVILVTAFIALGMARYEIVRRARVAYKEGDAYFQKGDFRRALWSYQEVLDFYTKPHSSWVDMAEAQVKICEEKLKDEDPVQALDKLLGISPAAPSAPAQNPPPKSR